VLPPARSGVRAGAAFRHGLASPVRLAARVACVARTGSQFRVRVEFGHRDDDFARPDERLAPV
jgi:hypothetical protein